MPFTTKPGVATDMAVFLDSNILLYALGDDELKYAIAQDLLAGAPTISTQVVNECSHVLRRKMGWPPVKVAVELMAVIGLTRLVEVRLAQIRTAWRLAERYRFSHYDSLIVASALDAGCLTLHSEDLHHGQLIEGRLTIVNPFLAAPPP